MLSAYSLGESTGYGANCCATVAFVAPPPSRFPSRPKASIDFRKGKGMTHRGHWSDCAVNNEPESPAGPCDCGLHDFRDLPEKLPVYLDELPGVLGDFLRDLASRKGDTP